MRTYVLTHLSDAVLLHELTTLVAEERATTAVVLAHIAEVDFRRLYLPAGFKSMHAYCVGKLHLSEDAAAKRIQVARKARELPALFGALAEGRVHLTGLGLLVPHLTAGNADTLLAEAVDRTKLEIEEMLARRFPGNECMELVEVYPAPWPTEHAPAHVASARASGPAKFGEHAPAHVPAPAPVPPSQVKPLATDRYTLQLTLSKEAYDQLRYAQSLLGHQVPSGDLASVIGLALGGLVDRLERRKFAKATKPRSGSRRPSLDPRHIPAEVKRAVWERDQGRCTFVGDQGQRCGARERIEFDHVEPVARGGSASVEGMRLRCSGHNQLEAERMFGAKFMQVKRETARRVRAARVARAAENAGPQPLAGVDSHMRSGEAAKSAHAEALARASQQRSRDLVACLRELRFGVAETRRAVEFCARQPEATLEEQVRAALAFLCPRPRGLGAPGSGAEHPHGSACVLA